jgi:hypothetical protein
MELDGYREARRERSDICRAAVDARGASAVAAALEAAWRKRAPKRLLTATSEPRSPSRSPS